MKWIAFRNSLLATAACWLGSSMSSVIVVAQAADDGDDDLTYPSARYTAWSELNPDAQSSAASDLGYDESTWDMPGTNDVEQLSWFDLTIDQRVAAVEVALEPSGIAAEQYEDVWDCYVNHYSGYDWVELGQYGIDVHYVALGWDQPSWDGESDPPPSDFTPWIDLTDAEREAADELCFFEEIWDGNYTIPEWEQFATTDAPTSPAEDEDEDQDAEVTQQPAAPTPAPTPPPTQDGSVIPPYPEFRYTPFELLDAETRQLATSRLGYDESTWDLPGTALVEVSNSWSGLTSDQQQAASTLGFASDGRQWDCYQNHFEAYTWSDLRLQGVRRFFEDMGWSEQSWLGLAEPPSTENATWAELTPDQKDAAEHLCFFNYTWDSNKTIPEWDQWADQVNSVGDPAPPPASSGDDESAGSAASSSSSLNDMLIGKAWFALVGLGAIAWVL